MTPAGDGLRALDVADDRLHAEAFGPSSLIRTPRAPISTLPRPPASTKPIPVVFVRSDKEARWTPGAGTLLELAEARGLRPDFSCRMGTCGTCRTKLVRGAVAYVKEPTTPVSEDEVLICSAVPAEGSGLLLLAL